MKLPIPSLQNMLAFALMLTACAGDDGADEPLTPRTFAARLTTAVCKNVLECRLAYDDASQLRNALGTQAECERKFAPRVGDGRDGKLFGVSTDDYVFSAEAAETCLQRIPSQCFALEVEEPESLFSSICAEVFDGQVALGGSCAHSGQCQGDAWCDLGAEECGPGVCRARKDEGESCEEVDECKSAGAESVACYGRTFAEAFHCTTASTRIEVGAGEECGFIERDGQGAIARCKAPLICHGPFDETRTCVPPVKAGEACDEMPECEPGHVCTRGNDADERDERCYRLELRKEGETCDVEDDTFGLCEGYFDDQGYCGEDARCHRAAGEGEACGEEECGAELDCHYAGASDVGECMRPIAEGELCQIGDPCRVGFCREADDGSWRCLPVACD